MNYVQTLNVESDPVTFNKYGNYKQQFICASKYVRLTEPSARKSGLSENIL
jgi:hypothetical protein